MGWLIIPWYQAKIIIAVLFALGICFCSDPSPQMLSIALVSYKMLIQEKVHLPLTETHLAHSIPCNLNYSNVLFQLNRLCIDGVFINIFSEM